EFPEQFFGGLWFTVQISIFGLIGSLVLGTVIALCRVSPVAVLRWLGGAYVEFFRNTPLVVQLFFLFLGLPLTGFRFATDTFDNIFRAAVAGMALYHAAYVAEIVRGGLLGVDKGQIEAARTLGLSYAQMLRYVQLPQTFRSVIPPLGNIAIALVKNTSLASTIGVAELLFAAEFVETRTFRAEEAFLTSTMLYLLLTIPMGVVVNALERRMLIER
ncbi:MAG TPA: amino acid ABC transporter permease, partial [Candidatus Limnocylindria bacterium]|nr:amino acid ABC transporter permease [Candidatus Limnocylindria bacterium]